MNNIPITNLIFLVKNYEIEKTALYEKISLLTNSFTVSQQTVNEIDLLISNLCHVEHKIEKVYDLLSQINMQNNTQKEEVESEEHSNENENHQDSTSGEQQYDVGD